MLVIAVLYGEIHALENSLSEMSDLIRTLTDKLDRVESLQHETVMNSGMYAVKKDSNVYGVLGGFVMIAVGLLTYISFGGGGTGDLGNSIDRLSSQSTLINENFVKGVTKICYRLNGILNTMVTKDNVKSIVSDVISKVSKGDED